jgi:putative FmdB family regulatory protein
MFKCYDYKCNECDEIFEELLETNKSESVRCPHCDSLDVTRQFPMPQRVTIP